jgi:hypothetical protein
VRAQTRDQPAQRPGDEGLEGQATKRDLQVALGDRARLEARDLAARRAQLGPVAGVVVAAAARGRKDRPDPLWSDPAGLRQDVQPAIVLDTFMKRLLGFAGEA